MTDRDRGPVTGEGMALELAGVEAGLIAGRAAAWSTLTDGGGPRPRTKAAG